MIPRLAQRTVNKAGVKSRDPVAQQTYIQFLVCPSLKGPTRCLHCRKPFKRDEAWRRHTSPADTQFGSYTTGIHEQCLRK